MAPALAAAATRHLAEAGATQAAVRARRKDRHGVAMGVHRLRALAAAVAAGQTGRLADRVLDLWGQADTSRGRHTPVVSVGRGGVTLRDYRHRYFETAGVATPAVFARRGRRLGTVYVGCVPEPKQTTLSESETAYYRDVLRRMRHLRTQARLRWQRVVDFYHAMERVWAMAERAFGAGARAGAAWARRMGKLLKKPNGPFRVLHAAAALRARRGMSKTRGAGFGRAYQYIRPRTGWMQYHAYARQHMPLGRGVTEAARKTLVAQRLKVSGMRRTTAGAQVILDLRAAPSSGTWAIANQDVRAALPQPKTLPPAETQAKPVGMAA